MSKTKKSLILEIARGMNLHRAAPSDLDGIARRLIVQLGPNEGPTSLDYVASVLEDAGIPVVESEATVPAERDRYEEEFRDLLHFSTLNDAEVSLVRLDQLWRKFQKVADRQAVNRVRAVAQKGQRRAMMIARNAKVASNKRAEKEEIALWFSRWLELPDAFFDWLELRKQSPEFQERFGTAGPTL